MTQCPNCNATLVIALEGAVPAVGRQRNGQITPLRSSVLEDILETLQAFPTGERVTTEVLYQRYLAVAGEKGRDDGVTANAFGRAMTRYGAKKWRNASRRGYIIPELPEKPLKIDTKAKQRLADERYREFVGGGDESAPMLGAPAGAAPAPRDETVELAQEEVPQLGPDGWKSVKLPWE